MTKPLPIPPIFNQPAMRDYILGRWPTRSDYNTSYEYEKADRAAVEEARANPRYQAALAAADAVFDASAHARNKIHDALLAVNGRARDHTYTTWYEIACLAEEAETQLESLGIPKGSRRGAIYVSTSGKKLPSAYKYSVCRTQVRLIRQSKGWALLDARRLEQAGMSTPYCKLALTPIQDVHAVNVLRRGYVVQSEE